MADGFDLGKQVGPLPIGAWIGVVGGGLLIGWYFSKGATKPDSGVQVPLTEPGVGQGGGQFIFDPPTQVETPAAEIQTNSDWARKATNWLIAKGYDPSASVSAVTKFLTGQNRTLHEQTLINLALLEYGAPPDEVPLPETPAPQPKPSPAPGTPKPVKPLPMVKSFTYHTVATGQTIGSIAKQYKTSWWNIYIANDKLGLRPDGKPGTLTNPYTVKPGMILVIPTRASGGLTPPPSTKFGPLRYHTVRKGETLTTIGKLYGVHSSSIFIANDVVGPRPDGSKGFLLSPASVKTGARLIIPYN